MKIHTHMKIHTNTQTHTQTHTPFLPVGFSKWKESSSSCITFSWSRLDHSPDDSLAGFLGAGFDAVPEQHGTLMSSRLSCRHEFFFQDPYRHPKRFKSDVYKGYKLTGSMIVNMLYPELFTCVTYSLLGFACKGKWVMFESLVPSIGVGIFVRLIVMEVLPLR